MVNSIQSASIMLLAWSSLPLLVQGEHLPHTDILPPSSEFDNEPDRAIVYEIVQHAKVIEDLLLRIKNTEQAQELMPRLRFHYNAIAQKITRAKELIDTEQADIIIAQEFRRDVAQQFGRLSICCLRIQMKGAYGNEDLKQFVSQFCPKEQLHVKLQRIEGIKAMRMPLKDSLSPELERIENALFVLYETLRLVNNLETAEENAEKIADILENLEPSYGTTRQMMKMMKSELEKQMLNRRLESIRHIGALCRAEMVRVREASYFSKSALANIVKDPYESMERLKKEYK